MYDAVFNKDLRMEVANEIFMHRLIAGDRMQALVDLIQVAFFPGPHQSVEENFMTRPMSFRGPHPLAEGHIMIRAGLSRASHPCPKQKHEHAPYPIQA